ncbi:MULTISPECIES: GDCCVxC domain-containing (seleno)protein [unclassified Vibrio]|uniref:GDCCVxC domain-containing (seleno)protein n=1 Tax=unclassified Vibrio TaxID=2614977 RepID=UPI002351AAA9|nr:MULTISPECIES: GDCCVxC domain-containing (seleno)protein [unclassified Vibrio]
MHTIIGKSELTCPVCGYKEILTMPQDVCQWFHECSKCHVLLKPKPHDCCVFCSYGSVPCPPIQRQGMSGSTEGDYCDQ